MNAANKNRAEHATNTLKAIKNHSRADALSRLSEHFPDMFAAHPVEKYIQLLDATQGEKSMYYSAPEVERFRNELVHDWDEEALEIYHRVTMLTLIEKFTERARSHSYPDSIHQ